MEKLFAHLYVTCTPNIIRKICFINLGEKDINYLKAAILNQKMIDQKQVKNVEYFSYFLVAW